MALFDKSNDTLPKLNWMWFAHRDLLSATTESQIATNGNPESNQMRHALVLAAFGVLEPAIARTVALVGVLAFTAIWGAFLAGGQWFNYWVSERSPQSTHFFMLLWGIATLIFLAQGA
jgi:hypothetical protein